MSQLIQALSAILPAKPVITDSVRRLAYGTNASFYRLTPEVVAVVECEEEVQALLQAARAQRRAVTNSVLALMGEGFGNCDIGLTAETGRPYHSIAPCSKSAAGKRPCACVEARSKPDFSAFQPPPTRCATPLFTSLPHPFQPHKEKFSHAHPMASLAPKHRIQPLGNLS